VVYQGGTGGGGIDDTTLQSGGEVEKRVDGKYGLASRMM